MSNMINFITQYFRSNLVFERIFPASIYFFKINNANTRTTCEICLNLTIKTSEGSQWRRFVVFIVNFELILHHCTGVSIVNFEQVNASWVNFLKKLVFYWKISETFEVIQLWSKLKIFELNLLAFKFRSSGYLFLCLTLYLKQKFELMKGKQAKFPCYFYEKYWKKNRWDQSLHYFSPRYIKRKTLYYWKS